MSLIAAAIGAGVAYVDSRPNWDDTGITAGVVILAAGLLSVIRPRTWWLSGLLVGAPIPIANYALHRNLSAIVALVIAMIAAAFGALIGNALFAEDHPASRAAR